MHAYITLLISGGCVLCAPPQGGRGLDRCLSPKIFSTFSKIFAKIRPRFYMYILSYPHLTQSYCILQSTVRIQTGALGAPVINRVGLETSCVCDLVPTQSLSLVV